MNDVAFEIVACIAIMFIFAFYYFLTRKLSKKEIKKLLEQCIISLGSELKTKLIRSQDNEINNLLYDYLNDADVLDDLAKHIKKYYNPSKFSSLTFPGVVMRSLIKEIISEQLKIDRKDAILLEKSTFDELSKISPFLYHYCVIAKLEDNSYYSDFLSSKPEYNMLSTLRSSFDEFTEQIYKKGFGRPLEIIMPAKPIFLFQKRKIAYMISFDDPKALNVTLYNNIDYKITGLILHQVNIFSAKFIEVGGNNISADDFESIQHDFTRYSNMFLGIGVCEKRIKPVNK